MDSMSGDFQTMMQDLMNEFNIFDEQELMDII